MDLNPHALRRWRMVTATAFVFAVALTVNHLRTEGAEAWEAFLAAREEAALTAEGSSAAAFTVQAFAQLASSWAEPIIMLLILGLIAARLANFVFREPEHSSLRLHERMAPRLNQLHRYHVNPAAAGELPRISERGVVPVLDVLEAIEQENMTLRQAQRRRQGAPSVWAAWEVTRRLGLYRVESPEMFDVHQRSLGRLHLTHNGHRMRKELRLRVHAQDGSAYVNRSRLEGRRALHVPEVDVWLTRRSEGWCAVHDADPVTGRSLAWRNSGLHDLRSGALYTPDGKLSRGPGRKGLTTFPVEVEVDRLRIDLSSPIPGPPAEHKEWTQQFIWRGSYSEADDSPQGENGT